MGAPTTVLDDIPGALELGNITIASSYTINLQSGSLFQVNANTGPILTFTSTGAAINPQVNLFGTWLITSTAAPGNTINSFLNQSTGGNLNLANGVLKLGGANNAMSGVVTVGNEQPLMGNPAA